MSKLQKPSQQAQESLDAVGLSGDRLKELLAEQGLLGTLTILKERLGDNGFVRFLEDQEAIRAGVALTTGDMTKMNEIFDQVADSTGATDKAFATWAESMGAKNSKAFAQFQIALIRLGDIIAPLAADLLGFAASVVSVFGELPAPLQKAAVAALALLAAAGPLTTVAGKLISGWGMLVKLWDNWSSAGGKAFAAAMNEGGSSAQNLGRQAGPLGAAGGLLALEAAAVVALVAIHQMGKAAHDAKIKDLTEDFLATGDAADLFGEALDGNSFEMGNAADVLDKLIDSNLEAAERFVNAAEAAGMEKDAVASAREAIDKKRQAEAQSAADASSNQEAIDSTTLAMADQEQAVNEAAEAFAAYADQVKATFDPAFALLNSLRKNDEAQRTVTESLNALTEARKEHGRNSAEAAEAEVAYQDALIGVGESALDVQVAAASLNQAVAENPALLDSAMASLQQWRDQGLIPTDEQLHFLQEQIKATGLQAAALGEVDPSVDVSETGSKQTQAEMRRTKDAATDIPSRRNTHMSTSGFGAAANTIGGMINLISQIPANRTISITARAIFGPGIDLVQRLGGFGGHAAGGPMKPGEIAWVGEDGPELYQAGPQGGHVYNQQQLGALSSPMSSGASPGGGGATIYQLDMRGAIVTAGERQFRNMVQRAFNEAQRKGRGLNAA
jgi:hypothetical protein